ncbi:hydroxymethylbilane synthase [Secundilactobacillus silagei]|uniref:Porphobilinogen deaminase n=1 Tax=Secundilactobacillus silagei JCM 19001 TaxID=1302250 RepID=A0A1Z5IFN9_9LACO|nr:hydroxymethylbilane synthase [Secundilactobacillus silagei]TDG72066.1 hypothetical protein C5L25_002450 [Secundilactobacillus silagei JCM 19001]GAX00496.1 hydroxymethylbilane synthase [Secundilactobacillus silagei JCM 19001]
MKTDFIVGTRQSKLAMRQTQIVVQLLKKKFPKASFSVKKIVTEGDRNLKDSLQKIGGKGVFIKEIEQEMIDQKIDFAVHSLKDVTPVLPDGLMISAYPKRESPYDCLVSAQPYQSLDDLPKGARIGTNSSRRQGQLLYLRPDLEIVPIRGNVDTRLKKIATEHLNGVVLAEAGLNRLGVDLSDFYQLSLKETILPAAGQGAIAIECRQADADTRALLATIDDQQTRECVTVERAFLRKLGGSCNYPIGSYAYEEDTKIQFTGLVASTNGHKLFKKAQQGAIDGPVGTQVAQSLIDEGALDLIK